jgi:type II secretory pathway pseudopilin PulG
MIAPGATRRAAPAGITLTEILISIMIMGVGLLSLATLFPLGILRVREAARASRSALLTASATDQIAGQGLFQKSLFTSLYGFDPFLVDPAGLNRLPSMAYGGPSFPIAYDPLWWYEVEVATGEAVNRVDSFDVARFGGGAGAIRPDASDGGPANAWGLPRLTNVKPLSMIVPGVDPIPNVEPLFASIDDLVYREAGNTNLANPFFAPTGSPVVPQLQPTGGMPQPLVDLSYSWMFTGRQSDNGNGLTFDGDVVIFQNRPFALDPTGVAGETVVEAVWGFGPPNFQYAIHTINGGPVAAFSNNDTTVLLRWPARQPDPDIRLGSWIADVTYVGDQGTATGRYEQFINAYPPQRCNWYRIVRRTDTSLGQPFKGDAETYKQMIVTVDRPVRAKTPIVFGNDGPEPYRTEVALVSPYVVNVFPRVFVVRP